MLGVQHKQGVSGSHRVWSPTLHFGQIVFNQNSPIKRSERKGLNPSQVPVVSSPSHPGINEYSSSLLPVSECQYWISVSFISLQFSISCLETNVFHKHEVFQ